MKRLQYFLLLVLAAFPAHANSNINFFPPENLSGCRPNTAIFFDGVSNTKCVEAIRKTDIPVCSSGSALSYNGNNFICVSFDTPPATPTPTPPVTPAPTPPVTPAPTPQHHTPLYVGTVQNCNAGVVTTNPSHLNCTTQSIGYTSDLAIGTALYLGTVQNCNAGVVTTNPNHLNCATDSIGYVSNAPTGADPLYLGTVEYCNAGVVSTNPQHLNCDTTLVGYPLQ